MRCELGPDVNPNNADETGLDAPGLKAPARRDRLSEEVAHRLRAAILSGDLRPGSRLVESAIADGLGVSKSPVREAIRMLAGEGIVIATQRRGAFVRGMTERDAHEIRVLRETLESLAVGLAMEDASPEWVSGLQQLASAMRVAQDRSRLLQLHTRFHEALTSQSRNERLSEILTNLSIQTRAVLPFIDLLSGGQEVEAEEHEAIVAAIETGDVAATQALLKEHIGLAADQLEAMWRIGVQSDSRADIR